MNRKKLTVQGVIMFALFVAMAAAAAQAQEESEPNLAARILLDRPDPREIPVPMIETSLPSMPGVDQLPVIKDMPDALTMKDGTKVTSVAQFKKRQQEMRAILEYYHTGRLPPAPGNVKGQEVSSRLVLDGKARYRLVHLTFGPGEKLSLDVGILTPVSDKPVPVVIYGGAVTPPGGTQLIRLPRGPTQAQGVDILLPEGMGIQDAAKLAEGSAARSGGAAGNGARGGRGGGRGAGNTDAAEALAQRVAHVINRGYGYIMFNGNDAAEDTTLRTANGTFAFRTTRFAPAYPSYDWGVLGIWAWATSRVVDYLQTDPMVDKSKVIVTGLSRYGKSAMIAGAFDDRIALVAPGASSGLGTPAYRFSGGATETQPSRGGHEGLTLMMMKYANWFSPHLHEFWGQPDKLPFDAHWFAALTAPRAFLMLEGTHDPNVVHNGVRQTFLAAQSSYALHGPGATSKLGVYWSDRPHGFGANDWEGLLAFADKHLLGKSVANAFDLFPEDTERTANK